MKRTVQIKILDEGAAVPEYATGSSAGLDLKLLQPVKGQSLLSFTQGNAMHIPPGRNILFHTGISIYIGDRSLMGMIVPRSSKGHKDYIVLGNGTGIIDADYQGEIFLSMHNNSRQYRKVEKGERVAQLIIVPVIHADFDLVEYFTGETARGEGGFGHTGKD